MSASPEHAPSAVEQWVGDALTDLGLPVESPSDDFFALGGTSLTVIRLIARAEEEFGEDCLPPDEMYENSSIRDIAALIVRNSKSRAEV